MINSSKTEYAFWKLKILGHGQDEPKWDTSLALTSLVRIPTGERESRLSWLDRGVGVGRTHVSEIAIQDFYVAMDDLERHEFVVSRRDPTHKEERGVSSVDNLGIWKTKEWAVSTFKTLGHGTRRSTVRVNTETYPCIPRNYTSWSASRARAG